MTYWLKHINLSTLSCRWRRHFQCHLTIIGTSNFIWTPTNMRSEREFLALFPIRQCWELWASFSHLYSFNGPPERLGVELRYHSRNIVRTWWPRSIRPLPLEQIQWGHIPGLTLILSFRRRSLIRTITHLNICLRIKTIVNRLNMNWLTLVWLLSIFKKSYEEGLAPTHT